MSSNSNLVARWIDALNEAHLAAKDRETAEKVVLGNLLQDACASALRILQQLGHIRRFVDNRPFNLPDPTQIDASGLVRLFARQAQKTEKWNPDFWVQLLDGTEIDIECKNWEAKPKKYANRYGDRWLYIWDDRPTKNPDKPMLGCWRQFDKNWRPGRKKVLLVSKMDVFEEHAQDELRKLFDGIVEVGFQMTHNPDQADGNYIAFELYSRFQQLSK